MCSIFMTGGGPQARNELEHFARFHVVQNDCCIPKSFHAEPNAPLERPVKYLLAPALVLRPDTVDVPARQFYLV